MNDDDARTPPGDPTHGLRSDLDTTFTTAEPRIRARIAAAIAETQSSAADVEPTPFESLPAVSPDDLPTYGGGVATATRRRRRRVVGALSLAGAAAAAAVVIFLLTGSPGGRPNGLERAAGAAQASTSPFDPRLPLDVVTTRTERRGSAIVSRDVAIDLFLDGSAYGALHEEKVASGDPVGVMLEPLVSGPMAPNALGGFTLAEVADLPTDPTELIDVVGERVGSEPDTPETAAALTMLAAVPELPPGLRAAALRALGSLATSDPIDGTDPLGRPGTLVAGNGWAVIVDDGSGQVLAFAEGPTSGNPSGPADAEHWTVWRDILDGQPLSADRS